ncbi:cupin domain-containing protein [Amycolatopsis sp. 195334CR]|uniref:cupin domain-containing protein n=1 Tax=Amycolatopsis sp. 195334CR TaxID=2814588 RepID=UPI001A8E42AA|nr:cupin domain-containing protein [Amycolatopsis sp. 195334CR]MBN6040499.1 cupin [Amycolatopsis sp. 195334CR]
MMGGGFGLARLIHPVDPGVFVREHWENRPLVVHRDDPGYYHELLTLAEVDRMLAGSGVREPVVRVLHQGRQLGLGGDAGPDGLRVERMFARFRDGCTLALQFLHERHEPLRRACSALGEEFSATFQANAYLTPPHEQGLATHYDTHDVFVLQLSGSKRWRWYERPIRAPLPGQAFRGGAAGTPLAEFDLAAGDALYLPRGFPHDAVSTTEVSLHLTVGVRPVTWASVLLGALEELIERDARFRAALPFGFARDRQGAEEQLNHLAGAFRDALDPGALLDNAEEVVARGAPVSLDGHLLDLGSVACLSLSSVVSKRADLAWRLRTEGDVVVLSFHGKAVRMPARVAVDLEFAGEAGEFTARDLPGGLDERGRLVLVRRLVTEGFLTVVDR